jgi:hypothetical protein
MPRMVAENLFQRLRQLKPQIKERYKAKQLQLFGSFVRGEQKGSSDIDILVDFEEGADLFDLIGLEIFLEEELERKVDVVPRRALRVELQESILREAVSI